MLHRPNSFPGPDRVPYAGWYATGDTGIKCMQKIDTSLRNGAVPPEGDDFNHSETAFLVKGEKLEDEVAVHRDALEMRPLNMKNTFNKTIMSANCLALDCEYSQITHETQNGFTGGRNFIKNIVANDAAGRMYSCAYEGSKKPFLVPSNLPITVLFDFLAAFPSVIHEWIWAVLAHRKMPIHFINFFKANYHGAKAVFIHNGTTYNLLNFFSGVLQGCPGSALLFNNAIDPFLFKIHNILRANSAGIMRACADDIGITLSMLRHLRMIYPIFKDCKTLAGLDLKPSKCALVPCCEWSVEVQNGIKKCSEKTSLNGKSLRLPPLLSCLASTLAPMLAPKTGLPP